MSGRIVYVFTLIEILFVLVIVGMLAGIALPRLASLRRDRGEVHARSAGPQ